MELTSLGYRTDLALLRLGGTLIEDRGDHLAVMTPDNPTYWWGNFLLLHEVPTTQAAAQAWLNRFTATFPNAEHRALGFDGRNGTVAELDWFSRQGFTSEALVVLTATEVTPPASRNGQAEYRPLSSDEDWQQSVELRMRCNETYEPIAHRQYVTATVRTNRALTEAGHGHWFGAFLGDQLVSQMGLFAVDGELARFQSVETDPDHRRQGLAGSLLHEVSRYGLTELGADQLVMVADPDYVAIDLYRSVGFTETETQLQVERPPATPHVGPQHT
ncbi:MAG TPA: GNAT family N-acetyltransferase [Pseudonocardiaceae bacterium]|nr:GNAT family N-acetyltransferase [Pseudonocardiaceae bacterium]